jgi:hypothetical protein
MLERLIPSNIGMGTNRLVPVRDPYPTTVVSNPVESNA